MVKLQVFGNNSKNINNMFGFHWSSTFRGEDFLKSLRRTTDDDDRRQVMAIAHLKTVIYFVKLVRKRIKQMFSGSLEKQSLTLFSVYYDNFSNLAINFFRNPQDVGKLRCRIAQFPV
jgi:hypothetical protein